jgi:K+-sensing histidine kinase KdpD
MMQPSKKAEWLQGGERMSIKARAVPAIVSLAVIFAVTAVLWSFKLTNVNLHDPVFFYVLPLTVLAIAYGSGPAFLGVLVAFVCADYFLYEPLYTFDISTRVELGDLGCFSLLALSGVKCASTLFRPVEKTGGVKAALAATRNRAVLRP